MGNTKSFRMSDRIENMFTSIKKHYLTDLTDTEILFTAIEKVFEDGTLIHNSFYKSNIEEKIENERTMELFDKICELLEVISFSDGLYLEDEMIRFLTSECADCFFEGYDELEKISCMQYRQIWKNLQSNYGYIEEDLQKLGEILQNYYVENRKKEK